MLSLMRLEVKKYKLRSFLKGAVIANLIILGLNLLFIRDAKVEGDLAFQDYRELFEVIDTLVRATFIIFASTLIARLIIDEFKNNTISVLFMYPISRKKILAAKLMIVVIFTFCAIILSDVFISLVVCMVSINQGIITDIPTIAGLKESALKMVMNALSSAGISLIPLFFGMRKYSVPATIVSSIIIVSVIASNNGGFSLNDIIVIPITLALIGVSIAYLTIRKIDKADLV